LWISAYKQRKQNIQDMLEQIYERKHEFILNTCVWRTYKEMVTGNLDTELRRPLLITAIWDIDI
jgi:hypothetical protein